MTPDPGAQRLKALLETPSVPLENGLQALGAALETAHGAETGGAMLPTSARTPVVQLQGIYARLLQRVEFTETSNPGRGIAIKALTRMGSGLGNLETAIGLEGEAAAKEAGRGAAEMERAGSELERAAGSLG
jgi:hypothetical protein